VYPAPEPDPPALPVATGSEREGMPAMTGSGEEFAGVRPYQPGDPQKRIAWRLAARSEDLSVKLFDSDLGGDVLLDFASLANLEVEARLARLTGWVLMAEAAHLRFALHLPKQRIPADHGPAHTRRCLEALADYPEQAPW